ncbi:uncharacterized protein cubi_01150 [Cryptosporidium ubiquitum]|uniref:Uncharacterized protein n=1 Tax=Cryptosporidium ubiquitum TaxID=857276 RepID=A0A1J4MJ70_9CRYT|nr:uncharacterized protein cubi_01150 [Cryptosporidium ubiquitum]OII74306.1 hypothetical protein cubi_01150 [Cryptosporidium ubiquitum]
MDLDSFPKSLFRELVANKKFIHLVQTDASVITNNYLDFIWDIGTFGTRGSEDKLFSANKHLVCLLRRGLSLGIKLSQNDGKGSKPMRWFDYNVDQINIWILKRGMEKFCELFPDYRRRIEQITPIVGDDLQGLKLLALEKLDGENSQISYFDVTDQWVIGSKNVTILCSDISDLENIYYNKNRYQSAKSSAYSWFHTLEQFKMYSMEDYETEINNLKKFLKNNTLLCELIGNPNRQHIVNYSNTSPQLYFFGLVSKENEYENCFSPLSLMQYLNPFFFKYIVQFVNLPSQHNVSECLEKRSFENCCMSLSPVFSFKNQCFNFQSINELDDYLSVIQSILLTLRTNTEGIVLYFIRSTGESDQDVVLSILKLKTIRFSCLRLIREYLKNIVIKNFVINVPYKYNLASLNTHEESESFLKFVSDNFWFSVYKYLAILIQNTTDDFFNKINKDFKRTCRQISNMYNLFDQKATDQMESDFIFFKQLFLSSSIYLLTKIAYLSLETKKIDSVQLVRYFFDSYSSFLSDMEFQISNSSKITGINFNLCNQNQPCLYGQPNVQLQNLGNLPSGSTIELLIPPLNWSWVEIKNMLSQDFSLGVDTWILDSSEFYLNINSSDSEDGHSYIKPNYHIFVNIRHIFDNDITQGRDQLYNYYKITIFNELNSSSNSEKEVIFTFTENSIKMSTFRKSSLGQFKNLVSNLINKTTKIIVDEVGITEYSKLNANQQLVRKLEILPKILPWVNTSTKSIIPSGHVINIRDFEHLMYAVFGSNDLKYVIDAFYHRETKNDSKTPSKITDHFAEKAIFKDLRLESTFLLPFGIPGSGKSFILKSLIKTILSKHTNSYYFSALISGERVTEFNMEDESVYSLVVPSNEDSSGNERFDLILYVSRDGCAQSLMNGSKWNYNTLISDKASNKSKNSQLPNNSLYELSEEKFQKFSKKTKNCMDLIIESFIKLCSKIVEERRNEDSTKTHDSSEWIKRLKSVYDGYRNLKLLVLVDVNHTPEVFLQMSGDFKSKFKLSDITLYRAFVLFISKNSKNTGDKSKAGWKYIFSKEHVILSILRMIRRTSHSTLKGFSKKNVSILLHFLVIYSQTIKVLQLNGKVVDSTLSKETLELLGFKGIIGLKDKDSEFFSELSSEAKPFFNSLISDLPDVVNSVDISNPRNNEKLMDRFMSNLEELSKLIHVLPEPINSNMADNIYSNITSLCKNIPFKGSDVALGKLYYDLTDKFTIKPFDLEVTTRGELSDYLSQVRSKYGFTAIGFDNHKSSIETIIQVWNKHEESLIKVIREYNSKKGNHDEINIGDIPKKVSHITCCFFRYKTGSNTEKVSNVESLLDSQIISDMMILFSMPYIGRSYNFQVSYLIYIHDWKLAFLTVSSQKNLLEVPTNENNYDILINRKTTISLAKKDSNSKSDEGEINGNKIKKGRRNRSRKKSSGEDSKDDSKATNNQSALLLTSLLPFRKGGHPHITLFSGKFSPVISNVAISLLGNDFSELSSLRTDECEVRILEVQVNEQPLEGILNKGLSEDDSKLDPVKTLRILALGLWNEKIMLRGDLVYM